MGKTNKHEKHTVKKGESDAHKLRREYKDQLEQLIDLDDEEREEVDLDPLSYRYKRQGSKE